VTGIGDPVIMLLIWVLLAPLLALAAGMVQPRLAAWGAIAATAVAFLLAILALGSMGREIRLQWAPSWGIEATLRFDGLAGLYSLLATGIGLVVLIYASAYMPIHLHHEHKSERAGIKFWVLMTGFMAAMVWLASAQDLLLLFFAWDVTAVASYFLIGFDSEKPAARRAALMALFVTGVSAIGILIGAVMLWHRYETFEIGALAAQIEPDGWSTIALALIAIGALAKSAQVPLHFWLPRAMAAPTPVSSYLHSAAMVAAGVYLLARVYPLLAVTPEVREALVVIGFLSMAVGGLLALGSNEFKRLLAYSTIAQYGYVVVMLGLGGKYGIAGAALYVMAHALGKCGLFLTAGAVTEATGQKALSMVGGLGKTQPVLAVASGLCAATLAALPLTIGFFKDEVFFEAAHHEGTLLTVLAVIGAASTLGYIARFWVGIFLGTPKQEGRALPLRLVLPILVLGVIAVVGGVVIGPFAALASSAGQASVPGLAPLSLAYTFAATPANLMALAAWGLGALIFLTSRHGVALFGAFAELGRNLGPEHVYDRMLGGLNRLSDRIHAFEVHDLRSRMAGVLVPAGVLVGLAFLATPNENAWRVGTFTLGDLPLVLAMSAAAIVGLAATVPRDHLMVGLLLSGVGYSLTIVYALSGAPDVALVAVLVETLFSLLFVGMLSAMPARLLERASSVVSTTGRRRRDIAIGITSGIFGFVVCWGVLSRPAALETAAEDQIALVKSAHAKDVVTAILADFRGLDTMGEISVIGIALIGLLTLLRRRSAR
jgi:multicomponent Na+:H+ antiporter subunit A